MYSALKRDGVPLYKLARRGVEVERERARDRDPRARADARATPDRIDFAVDVLEGDLRARAGRRHRPRARHRRASRARCGGPRSATSGSTDAHAPEALAAMPDAAAGRRPRRARGPARLHARAGGAVAAAARAAGAAAPACPRRTTGRGGARDRRRRGGGGADRASGRDGWRLARLLAPAFTSVGTHVRRRLLKRKRERTETERAGWQCSRSARRRSCRRIGGTRPTPARPRCRSRC